MLNIVNKKTICSEKTNGVDQINVFTNLVNLVPIYARSYIVKNKFSHAI